MYSYLNLLIIGQQGVQVEETRSNVSSPVALDTQSAYNLDQTECSILVILNAVL